MARPGLRQHPKFKRLVFLLREPAPHVLGYLEFLWSVAYETGNPLLGDAVDVELAAEWPGEPGKLCQSLKDCKFLDEVDGGKYAVHDLFDHAPDYVQKRWKMEWERKQKGAERKHAFAPRNRKPSAVWRERIGGLYDPTQPNSELGNLNGIKAEIGSPPGPAQRKEPPNPPEGGGGAEVVQNHPPTPEEFVEAWNATGAFPKVRAMSDTRKRALKARGRDPSLVAGWLEGLARIARSPFCRGEVERRDGQRPWHATPDWFLRPDSLVKILEGAYDPVPTDGKVDCLVSQRETPEEEAARLRREREEFEAERERARREDKPSLKGLLRGEEAAAPVSPATGGEGDEEIIF